MTSASRLSNPRRSTFVSIRQNDRHIQSSVQADGPAEIDRVVAGDDLHVLVPDGALVEGDVGRSDGQDLLADGFPGDAENVAEQRGSQADFRHGDGTRKFCLIRLASRQRDRHALRVEIDDAVYAHGVGKDRIDVLEQRVGHLLRDLDPLRHFERGGSRQQDGPSTRSR